VHGRGDDEHLRLARGAQLTARIDKLLATGRITEDEAERVRQAVESGHIDAVVTEIRLRHARDWLVTAVADGRMTQAEADAVVGRLERGEDPRPLRGGRGRRERP
jgi:hypothetical protein